MKALARKALAVIFVSALSSDILTAAESDLIEPVRASVQLAARQAEQIPAERKQILRQAAQVARQRLEAGQPAQFTFICTHNSRRSHLSQIWAQTAAAYYGITNIQAASGGTEATACNIRTVKALRRAGFSVADTTGGKNPIYVAQIVETQPGLKLFSKVYNDPANPQKNFIAMMCCDQADEGCPVVTGSLARFPIHYKDPKISDGTPAEADTYDERSRQIASEMFYLMSQLQTVTTARK